MLFKARQPLPGTPPEASPEPSGGPPGPYPGWYRYFLDAHHTVDGRNFASGADTHASHSMMHNQRDDAPYPDFNVGKRCQGNPFPNGRNFASAQH